MRTGIAGAIATFARGDGRVVPLDLNHRRARTVQGRVRLLEVGIRPMASCLPSSIVIERRRASPIQRFETELTRFGALSRLDDPPQAGSESGRSPLAENIAKLAEFIRQTKPEKLPEGEDRKRKEARSEHEALLDVLSAVT